MSLYSVYKWMQRKMIKNTAKSTKEASRTTPKYKL